MSKKISITLISLCGVVCFLLAIICHLINNPKIIIEEKEVPVEVIVEVEKEVIVEVEKEIIVEKEVVVEVEVEKEPTFTHKVTSEEREMLARLLYREGNTESIDCQRAIVSVIINRWTSGMWGSTLSEVVYSPYQFEPAPMLSYTTPTETNYEVVDYILKNGVTIPEHVMYFRLDYHFSWDGYVPYQKIDDVCFGYMAKDKK
jgi:hypothetical protein